MTGVSSMPVAPSYRKKRSRPIANYVNAIPSSEQVPAAPFNPSLSYLNPSVEPPPTRSTSLSTVMPWKDHLNQGWACRVRALRSRVFAHIPQDPADLQSPDSSCSIDLCAASDRSHTLPWGLKTSPLSHALTQGWGASGGGYGSCLRSRTEHKGCGTPGLSFSSGPP
ncbi:hypothetical protein BGZ61DRAFT_198805 [Ilyonectria robusta]|uniref:uncharacterized protein n=1 Tax=Ilyonectria robusta TaxID=1079257 RepID=UPI001E8CCAE6|nr:uncharacterized protein BGZ61DRAFT_198805 [Ilyonectria robusta]KAH8722038.1 hypothetical protein BGZ61DRAFT_198805 [Ilyonectria robusta]